MRNSGWNKQKNLVVQTGQGPASCHPPASGLDQEKWEPFNSSNNVFAVLAFVCIFSKFRACFCWSKQTAPLRADCRQKYWDVAPASQPRLPALKQSRGGKKQPCSFQARCAGPDSLPGSHILGAFCPCSRCVADMPTGSLLAALRSWSGAVWCGALVSLAGPGPGGNSRFCLVPLWHKQTANGPEASTLMVPMHVSNSWLSHAIRVTASSRSSPISKKGSKRKLLYYTQISTSETMFLGSSL